MSPLAPSASNSSDYFEADDPDFLQALQNTVLPGDLPVDAQSPPPTQPSSKRSYQVFQEEDDRDDIYGAAHFGDFGEYMRRKRAKLQIQNAEIAKDETLNEAPQIFKGISIYVCSCYFHQFVRYSLFSKDQWLDKPIYPGSSDAYTASWRCISGISRQENHSVCV